MYDTSMKINEVNGAYMNSMHSCSFLRVEITPLLQKSHFTSVEIDISHRVPADVTKGEVKCLELFTSGTYPM
ncbi:hypothetical protein MTR_7g023600 [Medicago truncatula]|uniref:Uncharacterized protein n=1 Tax=Medicago truncatula TaxID=3880 RepID=G7KVQ5_MEDTR|nr:hypothetical protein MTR_7g023600 [Medicago truncatula]